MGDGISSYDGIVPYEKEIVNTKEENSSKKSTEEHLRYITKVADVPGRRTFPEKGSGGSTDGKSSATDYSVSDLFALVN